MNSLSHVIIVGRLAPWEGPVPEGAALWGSAKCLDLQKAPPLDVLFLLHDPEEWLDEQGAQDYIARVNSWGGRVICRRAREDLNRSREFPLREVVTRFGLCYFTSTMAWQIAYALYLGVGKITIHRVFALPGSLDYFEQKPCLDFWAGVALGMGVELEISADSSIARPWPWQTGLYAWYRKLDPGIMGRLLKMAIEHGARVPVKHQARPEASILDGLEVNGIHRYQVPQISATRRAELAAEESVAGPRVVVPKKGGRRWPRR